MDGCESESVSYYSDGVRIDALFFPADEPDVGRRPTPAIVFCPGSRVTKSTPYYADYVRRLTTSGLAVLLIDYRGWGASQGEPGTLFPLEQVADIRNGLTYLESRPEVAPEELGVFGVSLGGTHAVYAAGVDDRIRATVAVLSPFDGADFLRRTRREYEWQDLLDQIRLDRARRMAGGPGGVVADLYPPLPDSSSFSSATQEKVPPIPLACIEAIIEYRPLDVVSRISPRALLLFAADRDPLCPPEASRSAFRAAGHPKRLIEISSRDHYETYINSADLILAESIAWFWKYLAVAPIREVTQE